MQCLWQLIDCMQSLWQLIAGMQCLWQFMTAYISKQCWRQLILACSAFDSISHACSSIKSIQSPQSEQLTRTSQCLFLWIYLCLSKIEWQFKTITKLGIGQLMKIVTDMCFCPNTSSLLLALVSPLCSSFLGPIPETAVSAVWAVLISMGIFFVLLIRQGKILRKLMNWSADCTATPHSAFFWLSSTWFGVYSL